MLPGPWELIVIFLIVLLVFGARRIPEIMGGIGKGIRAFKKNLDVDESAAKPSADPNSPPKDSIDPK